MSSHTRAWPATSKRPMPLRTTKLAVSPAIMTARRGSLSPSTPPNARVATCATVHAERGARTLRNCPRRERDPDGARAAAEVENREGYGDRCEVRPDVGDRAP